MHRYGIRATAQNRAMLTAIMMKTRSVSTIGWKVVGFLLLKLFDDFGMLGDDFFDEIVDILERSDLEQILVVAERNLEGMLQACDQIHDVQTVEFKIFEDFLFGRQILWIEFEFVNENLVDRLNDFFSVHALLIGN